MNFAQRYPLTLGLTVCIVALSLMYTGHTQLDSTPFIDKMVHASIYATLSLALWWESRTHGFKWVLTVVVFPIAFSGVMELLQAYCTTYRAGEWLDLAANSLGVVLATSITGCVLWLSGHFTQRS